MFYLTNNFVGGIIHRHLRKVYKYRGVEQLVARRAHNPEVEGSSPSPATKKEPIIDTIVSVIGSFFMSGYWLEE